MMEKKAMSKAHPGFKAVQEKIAHQDCGGEPCGEKRAGAILAARSRGASAAAKRKNPRLNRVRGGGFRKAAGV